jgi:hypothetical protein
LAVSLQEEQILSSATIDRTKPPGTDNHKIKPGRFIFLFGPISELGIKLNTLYTPFLTIR